MIFHKFTNFHRSFFRPIKSREVFRKSIKRFFEFFFGGWKKREYARGYEDKMDRRRGEMVRVKRGGDVFRM